MPCSHHAGEVAQDVSLPKKENVEDEAGRERLSKSGTCLGALCHLSARHSSGCPASNNYMSSVCSTLSLVVDKVSISKASPQV
jgi:hypothetical protein